MMFRKLLFSTILALSLLNGCKTEEPAVPQLRSVALARVEPEKPKEKKDYKKELEQIIQEHNVKYIDGVYMYAPEHKKELFDAIRKKFDYTDETLAQYEQVLDERQNLYGPLVLLPRDRIGTGQGSLLCLFQGMANYIQTKEDLESEIIDYAGHRAKDNAEGIILCGKKIGVDEINIITPLVYQDILDLRARTYQINELVKKNITLSPKFKEALFLKYAAICVNLGLTMTNLEMLSKKEQTDPRYKQSLEYMTDAVEQIKKMMEVKEVNKK